MCVCVFDYKKATLKSLIFYKTFNPTALHINRINNSHLSARVGTVKYL